MSETIFDRVRAAIEASGPAGIRTDELCRLTKAKPLVLNNYLRRHREAGVEIHTLLGIQGPGTLYTRRDWYDAAKAERAAISLSNRKAQQRARSQAKSELAAIRLAKAEAASAAKKALYAGAQKPLQQPAGALPKPTALPSQPVYSRHQLAALPPGFRSQLDPADCRPWARAAGQR